jgi:hypothetical protein
MTSQDDFSRQLENVIAIAKRISPELLQRPGVVAVGPGVERRKGKLTGKAAIVVTVRKKLSLKHLKELGEEPLPKQLEGLPVDVVEYQKPVESNKIQKELKKAIDVKNRVAAAWLKESNVTGIGVGYKVQGGHRTDNIAIQLFVSNKLAPNEVERGGFRPIPERIDNIPTDVVQAGPFKEVEAPSGSRGDRKDPLTGGLSIGRASSPFHYGTLAAIAFDNANSPVVLSNEHVLDGDIEETVHQPSPVGLDDSLEVSFQLDVCNPANFVRLDTPDTLGGSILAGAAAAAALAAALSDEIDPTREGQQATLPPPGTKTSEEYTKVEIEYAQYPLPGTPFKLKTNYKYERRTDNGILSHADEPKRENPHVLLYHRLFVDKVRYAPSQTIHLFGVLLASDIEKNSCKSYHCVALLRPIHLDQTFPVILRSVMEIADKEAILSYFFKLIRELRIPNKEKEYLLENQRRLCIYYGEFAAADVPLGPWRHWMHVQTVNTVPRGVDPLVAAKTIGGLPVSNHYKQTLDIACGPFVFEDDGSFDIELISV